MVALQGADRDGDVVEHAEPFTVVGKGVVRSAGEVHRDAVVERVTRRLARSACRAVRSLDQRLRPWKAQAALFVLREGAARESIHVVGGVNEQEVVTVRARRIVHAFGEHDMLGENTFAQQRVLGDRESMPVRERKAVLGAGPRVERHRKPEERRLSNGVSRQRQYP